MSISANIFKETVSGSMPSLLNRIRFGIPEKCWEWTGGKTQDGYGKIRKNRKKLLVHRVVFVLAYGPIPESASVVRHTCDNPSCVNPNHLVAGTIADNVRDRCIRGRSAKGEASGRAKISMETVRCIRRDYVPYKMTLKTLAKRYGITLDQVHRIARHKSWR